MTVLGRMGRSISQSFDALLDKMDDPAKSLEQTLREMREQLRAARREVVSGVAAERQLRARVEELGVQAERWGSRAELAVKSGDDELARAALLQKRRVDGERVRAEELRVEQRSRSLEMKSELERMQKRITEIEATKGTLATQVKQARAGGGAEALGAERDGSAFSELRRLEAEIDGVEVAVEAQRELDEVLRPSGPAGLTETELEARFRRLEAGDTSSTVGTSSDVEDELRAIKQRFRVEP
jgi:phage shock protein A